VRRIPHPFFPFHKPRVQFMVSIPRLVGKICRAISSGSTGSHPGPQGNNSARAYASSSAAGKGRCAPPYRSADGSRPRGSSACKPLSPPPSVCRQVRRSSLADSGLRCGALSAASAMVQRAGAEICRGCVVPARLRVTCNCFFSYFPISH
jgi:hypothetical protein